jgi:eukaryotic-like serine/threonine-protein kinase
MSVLPLNAIVGKYRIEKLVGAGGMGEVYRAVNLQSRTIVAVKALTHFDSQDTAHARFKNEAIIQYNLRHPHVAELYEYAEFQGRPCLVMEFVDGPTLEDTLRKDGNLSLGRTLDLMVQICDAMSYIHSKGITHRDIKAGNIRINSESQAKLLDFGISLASHTPALTQIGHVIGTPPNLSPEQQWGLKGDARSDVWALGILLYEMLTGVHPFDGSDSAQVAKNIMTAHYVPASRRKAGIPRKLDRVIAGCFRVKPDERFASGGVLLREIQQARRKLSARRAPAWLKDADPRWVAAAVFGVMALFIAVYLAIHPQPQEAGGSRNEPQPVESSSAPAQEPERKAEADLGRANPAVMAQAIQPGAPASTDSADRVGQLSPPAPAPADLPRALPSEQPAPQPRPESFPVHRTDSQTPPQQPSPPVSPQPALKESWHDVRVETFDGPAEVVSGGRPLGSTPLLLKGPMGARYNLRLRRPGYQPLDIQVQIGIKPVYTFALERIYPGRTSRVIH